MPETPQNPVPITRFEDTPEFAAYQARYATLFSHGNPYFVIHDSPLTDKSLMDGKWVLNFGSYNYAGMSGRPEVEEAASFFVSVPASILPEVEFRRISSALRAGA